MIVFYQKRYFSDDQEESTGKKIAKGLLATAAVAGTTFAAAKGGLLGGRAQIQANRTYGNLGAKWGSQSMMNSAAKGVGAGMMTLSGNARLGAQAKQQAAATWANGGNITRKNTNTAISLAKTVGNITKPTNTQLAITAGK